MRNILFIFRNVFVLLLLVALGLIHGCKKNIPPKVSLITPISYINFQSGDTLYVLAEATDEDGSVNLVNFYVDGKMVFSDATEPYEFYYTETDIGNYFRIDHSISVIAVDDKGDISPKASIELTVNPNDDILVLMEIDYSHDYYYGDTVFIDVEASSMFGEIKELQLYVSNIFYQKTEGSSYTFYYVVNNDDMSPSFYVRAIDINGFIGVSKYRELSIFEYPSPEIEFNLSGIVSYKPCREIHITCYLKYQEHKAAKLQILQNDSVVAEATDASSLQFDWITTRGTHSFKAVAIGYAGDSVVKTGIVEVYNGICIDGEIPQMIYTENPNLVFAINKKHRELMFIDPVDKQDIFKSLPLPNIYPIGFDYSEEKKQLFIIYEDIGVITKFDLETETFTDYNIPGINNLIMIKVDGIHNRIYLTTEFALHIIDMDSFSILYSDSNSDKCKIALDKENRFLYTFGYIYNDYIKKYSVHNDSLEFLTANEDFHTSWLSPDNSILAAKNSSGKLCFLDANTLENISTTSCSDYILGFSTTGKTLYLASHSSFNDDELLTFNTETFEMGETYFLPFSAYCKIFTVNAADNRVCAFVDQSTYYNNDNGIYFIETD